MDTQTNIQFEPQEPNGNEIRVFSNPQFGEIRTTVINGEPWFVGKDVAERLGYSNPQKAIRDHVDEEDRTVNESFIVNGTMATLINESGLYSLVLRSNLPTAKQFKRWVTSEVLPSIRKHGAYLPNLPDFSNPAAAARAWAEQYERNEQLAAQNHQQTMLIEQKDKEIEERRKENELLKFYKEQFDKITGNTHTLYSLTDVAKFIGMRTVGEFIEWALAKNILMRDRFQKSKRYVYHAKGDYAGDEKGYFKEIIPHTDSAYAVIQLKVTSLGVAKIRVVRERYLKRINKSYEEMMQQKEQGNERH